MKKFNNIKKFWLKKSVQLLFWKKKPKIAFIKNFFYFRWFIDGTLNVFENSILFGESEKFIENCNKTAIITASKDQVIKKYSYNDIYQLVFILSIFLKKIGNKNTKILMIM
jgi:hypothetical protein